MKIAKYVGDLLYDYECVVIPGLGGFITKDSSVSINEVTHNFTPPFRNVHFNIHLRANDGLLVNHVAQQEQIGYKTAKQRVDQFSFQCHNALNQGKKINFKNIGSIHYDANKNIVFNQDFKSNYNPNSFGLNSLVSPAIRRITDEQRIKNVVKSAIDNKTKRKKPTNRKTNVDNKKQSSGKVMQANRRKSSFTNQLIFLLVVAIIMGSGYVYMRRYAMEYYMDKYASHIPFFYSSVNDYLSTNINSSHVAKLSRSTASYFPTFNKKENNEVISNVDINDEIIVDTKDISDSNEKLLEIDEQPTSSQIGNVIEEAKIVPELGYPDLEKSTNASVNITTPTKKANVIAAATNTKRFFLIAGSFSKEPNAVALVEKLKNQGFDALIADTNKYGMFRVAFMSLNNRPLAESELLAIRNNTNHDAWLLVK